MIRRRFLLPFLQQCIGLSESVRIKDFITDTFFYAMAVGCVLLMGYLLYLGWEGEHPGPKQHWNQGPQDPEPTH